MGTVGKAIIALGALLIFVGLVLVVLERVGVRQWRLPGDIAIQRDDFSFYFPLGTSIVISIALSLVLTFLAWLASRMR